MNMTDASFFERNKIYEKLQTFPEPADYRGKIPWTVQQQIAATNGVHFIKAIGHLKEYPIPPIPLEPAKGQKILLDIGNGWGRWLVASARKGYIPVGIDLRLEFCELSRFVLRDNGYHGYSVVADLRNLPFRENSFDVVWSFSVIQHTHYDRLLGCLENIQRILNPAGGYCFLEFPNKNGLHNRFGPVKKYAETIHDYNSWDVRYYTPAEYKTIFARFFDNFRYIKHSVLGIGVLPGDLKYAVGFYNKMGILLSRSLSGIASLVPPLKAISDSIYIQCYKGYTGGDQQQEGIKNFLAAHTLDPVNNLNIVHLLCCPASKGNVFLSEDGAEIISVSAGLAYPIKNGTPIMVPSEARTL
jgi:ubiquinone/menaquinone biosynthesis C-methylase UbiE/uncharacterized protein YbaR (Trm112 family)